MFFLATSVALLTAADNIGSLADTDADLAFMVADDHQRLETETAAAFDYPGDAVDINDSLVELLFFFGRRRGRPASVLFQPY